MPQSYKFYYLMKKKKAHPLLNYKFPKVKEIITNVRCRVLSLKRTVFVLKMQDRWVVREKILLQWPQQEVTGRQNVVESLEITRKAQVYRGI